MIYYFQTRLQNQRPSRDKSQHIGALEVVEAEHEFVLAIGNAIAITAILLLGAPAIIARHQSLKPLKVRVAEDSLFVGEAVGEAIGVVLPTDVEEQGVCTKWPKLFITVNGMYIIPNLNNFQ